MKLEEHSFVAGFIAGWAAMLLLSFGIWLLA